MKYSSGNWYISKKLPNWACPMPLFGQEAEQPLVGVTILDRVCFEADVEG